MAKQRYELEIEEILRKCEEAALREQVHQGAHRSAPVRDRLLSIKVDPVSIEIENDVEQPAKKTRPSSGQLAALGFMAVLVGMLLFLSNVAGFVPLLILLGLAVVAFCAARTRAA